MMIRKVLHHADEILCGLFLLTMVLTVIVNVLLRYLFNYSLYWAEEVATICFVWTVFLGASVTYKHKLDVGIDALVNRLSSKGQSLIGLLVKSMLLLLNGYLFYISIVFTIIAFDKPTAVLGVSSAAMNFALVVSFGFICIYALKFWLSEIKRFRLPSANGEM